jgi:hypothetical protein
VAVRIDIRPRLALPEERPAKPRRHLRLPPLALPAFAYWLAMGGLTYFFVHHAENPFDTAQAAPAVEPELPPPPAPRFEPETVPSPPAHAAPSGEPQLALVEDSLDGDAESRAPAGSSRNDDADEREARRDARPRERSERELPDEPHAREARSDPALARADEPAPRLTFPEFSDSSRPEPRARAADGPRIDSLFERRDDRPGSAAPGSAAPAPPPVDRDGNAPAVTASCEAAVARNNETIELGAPRGPADVTREAYAGILQDGRYLSGCNIPDRSVFEICAAVKNGRAVGITVSSSPPNAALNACVRRAVSRLKFPSNPRLDVTHTRFGSAR